VVTGAEGFAALDMRVGTIVWAEHFPAARTPSYKLLVDFGDAIGRKRSSAQITDFYPCETLVGRQVVAAINLGTKRIASFESEVLVLGVPDPNGRVVLLLPERRVENGVRVF
jgi:tRNA-binding protein